MTGQEGWKDFWERVGGTPEIDTRFAALDRLDSKQLAALCRQVGVPLHASEERMRLELGRHFYAYSQTAAARADAKEEASAQAEAARGLPPVDDRPKLAQRVRSTLEVCWYPGGWDEADNRDLIEVALALAADVQTEAEQLTRLYTEGWTLALRYDDRDRPQLWGQRHFEDEGSALAVLEEIKQRGIEVHQACWIDAAGEELEII